MNTVLEHSCFASCAPINDVVQQSPKDEAPKREITQKFSRTLELVDFLWAHLLKNKTFSLDNSSKIQLNEIFKNFPLQTVP